MALPPPPPPTSAVEPHLRLDASHAGRRSSLKTWALIALAAALVGGAGGAVWTSSQTARYEASARASFIDRVDIGAVDAERARILGELGDGLGAAVAAEAPGAGVLVETPPGRNFIDVVVTSDSPDDLEAAAIAGVDAIVATESNDLVARLTSEADAERSASTALDDQVAELEAEMADWLEVEAAAEVRRSDDDAAVREQAFIDARNANDGYWKAARRRNALVDQQNEFVRSAERLDADARTAASLERSSSSAPVRDATASTALGVAGGVLVALSLVVLAAAIVAPRRR